MAHHKEPRFMPTVLGTKEGFSYSYRKVPAKGIGSRRSLARGVLKRLLEEGLWACMSLSWSCSQLSKWGVLLVTTELLGYSQDARMWEWQFSQKGGEPGKQYTNQEDHGVSTSRLTWTME